MPTSPTHPPQDVDCVAWELKKNNRNSENRERNWRDWFSHFSLTEFLVFVLVYDFVPDFVVSWANKYFVDIAYITWKLVAFAQQICIIQIFSSFIHPLNLSFLLFSRAWPCPVRVPFSIEMWLVTINKNRIEM